MYYFLGLLTSFGVGVLAYSYVANDVGFTPIDTSWEVEDVGEGLDSLHEKATHCDFGCTYSADDIVFELVGAIGREGACDGGDAA